MINLGYCCINNELRKKNIFTSRGLRKATLAEKGLSYVCELAKGNLIDINPHLRWNENNDIHLFRLSSGIFPWMSEYEIKDLPAADLLFEHAKNTGERYFTFNDYKHRITFHPDHFNVLASKNSTVVQKTIKELNQHAEIMDMLQLPQSHEAPINIHVNTTQGGKEECLKRFRENFSYLSDSCQNRLVVENDDKASQYTVEDLYEGLFERIKTPITFDYHHHKLNAGNQTEEEALKLASKTWPQDVRQLVHYSSSRMLNEDKKVRAQAHADYIYEKIETYGLELDIELEAKAKEQALLKYRKEFK